MLFLFFCLIWNQRVDAARGQSEKEKANLQKEIDELRNSLYEVDTSKGSESALLRSKLRAAEAELVLTRGDASSFFVYR